MVSQEKKNSSKRKRENQKKKDCLKLKDAMSTDHVHGIRNKSSKLKGGSMTVTDATDLLVLNGLKKESVIKAISVNPETYLQTN